MSNHSSSARNRPSSRSNYPSLASINPTTSGPMYGLTGEMRPPLSDIPPQPVEIEVELNSWRTLPSPSTSGSNAWDPIFQPHNSLGDGTYGSSNMVRMHQLPADGPARGPNQDPILQWYTGNDGPWVPKVIPDVAHERTSTKHPGNRDIISYGSQYRQPNPSDAGSVQFGVSHSDSGYGTRRSIGNTSVFSADVTERDQDCHSLTGHVENFQSFQGFNETFPPRDPRSTDQWPPRSSAGSDISSLVCKICLKPVTTQSELKKHALRHTKPFKCTVPGCQRTDGFSIKNDLERHKKSKHPEAIAESTPIKKFRCRVPDCKSKDKAWPRLDNFRSHMKRVHLNQFLTELDFEDMIRSAEYWDTPVSNSGRETPFSQPTFEVSPSSAESAAREMASVPKPDIHWAQAPPEAVPSPQCLPVLKRSDSNMSEEMPAQQEELNRHPEEHNRDPVQPMDIFQSPAKIFENKLKLESVLAPVGQSNFSLTLPYLKSPNRTTKATSHGKATRQNDPAADAALTEVIKTALSGTGNDITNRDFERSLLPDRPSPPGASLQNGLNTVGSGLTEQTTRAKAADFPLLDSSSDDLEKLKKVEEILKSIRDLGYILQKDPSLCPKIQNSGSAAGNRSDKQVICKTCKEFKGRPCELRKHMKRHERPYGCTFLACKKAFGSKNDWKRHENSQHFQIEAWRCDERQSKGGVCSKVCYRREMFQEHLKNEHQISDDDDLKDKVEVCRIGRNFQDRFWCGFCVQLIKLEKKGLEAWTERFDHIDNHFMGRDDQPKRNIQEWIPVDGSENLKGGPQSPPGRDSQDTSSEQSRPHSPQGTAINLEADRPNSQNKRPNSGDDERPTKHVKTATNVEWTIYCCQCQVAHNPKFHESCAACTNGHVFCEYCPKEYQKRQG